MQTSEDKTPDVAIFTMSGCPACEDFVPRVRRLSQRHRRAGLRIAVIDVERHTALADSERIGVTPTAVLPRAGGRMNGAGNDAQILRMLEDALAARVG
jgi:thiol-disulfide isomerase/thioredoxin